MLEFGGMKSDRSRKQAYNLCIENAVTSFLGDPLPISFYGRCFHGQSKYRQLPHILRQFILIDTQRDGVFLTAIWPAQVSAFIGALSVPCIHANRLPIVCQTAQKYGIEQ